MTIAVLRRGRYFVLTMNRLTYFKSSAVRGLCVYREPEARCLHGPALTPSAFAHQAFKNGDEPSGTILIRDCICEPVTSSATEFVLRSAERTYKLAADDDGVATRWMIAYKAMQVGCLPTCLLGPCDCLCSRERPAPCTDVVI